MDQAEKEVSEAGPLIALGTKRSWKGPGVALGSGEAAAGRGGEERGALPAARLEGGAAEAGAEGRRSAGGRALSGRTCGCVGRQDGITSEWFSL